MPLPLLNDLNSTCEVRAMVFDSFGQSQEGGHIGFQLGQILLLVGKGSAISGNNLASLELPAAGAGLREVEAVLLQLFRKDADIVSLVAVQLALLDGGSVAVVHDLLRAPQNQQEQQRRQVLHDGHIKRIKSDKVHLN